MRDCGSSSVASVNVTSVLPAGWPARKDRLTEVGSRMLIPIRLHNHAQNEYDSQRAYINAHISIFLYPFRYSPVAQYARGPSPRRGGGRSVIRAALARRAAAGAPPSEITDPKQSKWSTRQVSLRFRADAAPRAKP
ncbi:hypothetical protein EVAR_28223_1 [Eumeta japonica]|uniref:Uncharacterized protein n=1 Tax=Eumeta variegata TaxID=151549 RepID=A0A4C1V6F4_EUMVA|nr:hypothetical protein EVAR_28223_1 [Eumeta japonica]